MHVGAILQAPTSAHSPQNHPFVLHLLQQGCMPTIQLPLFGNSIRLKSKGYHCSPPNPSIEQPTPVQTALRDTSCVGRVLPKRTQHLLEKSHCLSLAKDSNSRIPTVGAPPGQNLREGHLSCHASGSSRNFVCTHSSMRADLYTTTFAVL